MQHKKYCDDVVWVQQRSRVAWAYAVEHDILCSLIYTDYSSHWICKWATKPWSSIATAQNSLYVRIYRKGTSRVPHHFYLFNLFYFIFIIFIMILTTTTTNFYYYYYYYYYYLARIETFTRRVQNSFCTNIVMLHTKSKIMKIRIQWCKNFCPGGMPGDHQRSKSRILGPFLLSHNSS